MTSFGTTDFYYFVYNPFIDNYVLFKLINRISIFITYS